MPACEIPGDRKAKFSETKRRCETLEAKLRSHPLSSVILSWRRLVSSVEGGRHVSYKFKPERTITAESTRFNLDQLRILLVDDENRRELPANPKTGNHWDPIMSNSQADFKVRLFPI